MDKIQDAYIEMYNKLILEQLHPELQNVIDDDRDSDMGHTIFPAVTKKIREIAARGEDTGLQDGKPKKGSSRAVFFPKEPKKTLIDNKETHVPTAVKIAMPGKLDKYHGETTLLGQDQNIIEGDHGLTYHSVLRQNMDSNQYKTNHEGVLAPVFDRHVEGHHLEMGRVEKYTSKDLANHTKTKEFPRGITHKQLQDTLIYEHNSAHGGSKYEDPEHEKLRDHPYVDSMINMMHDASMHPGDLVPRNMGTWVHPHTGHRYPVVIDYGFSNNIAKKYAKARRNASGY